MIRDRVRLLAAIDPDLRLFGATTHEYQLAPPLTEAELAALEAELGPLPAEYRAFVRTLAAHGAGPHYGLLEPRPPGELRAGVAASPARAFRCDRPTPGTTPCPPGAHLLDGTLVVAEQGRGRRSLIVVAGPRAGELWSDWTRDGEGLAPEAPSLVAWYEQWISRTLLEWCARAAPRIALEGPSSPAELEAIGVSYELVARAGDHPATLRTLGYLHLREQRFADAEAAFARAAQADHPGPHHALDRARVALVRGDADAAVEQARCGLDRDAGATATRDELYDVLEQALVAAGRRDDALDVLDERAADRDGSFDLHHRLARERLARNDVGGAGAALERAARMANILGQPAPVEDRVPASFDPIIGELRAAGRHVDADALAARATMILDAN
jgi:tetratricopeptide (TPR) repeat protein